MRTRQKRVATDTWRSLGCRTTPLEHWSKRKPTAEPRSVKANSEHPALDRVIIIQSMLFGLFQNMIHA